MARIYGYWDDELNTFVPTGGAPQQQGAMPIGGNQGSYGVPYNNAPRYNQRFYGPGYAPTNVAVGFNNGPRVRYNYQPRYTGNGYAPRGYNTNMNYGPWYGQQSYATYPPYAPYQPRYEWMPGSNGQPVAVRLGEYQREQPVAYETMFNSQGVPVQVPIYAPMNNSAMPVRVGVSPDGQSYGSANINSQAAFPQQTTQRRNTTSRVRNMPEPVATQALYRTEDWNDRMANDWQRITAAERANPDNNRVLSLPEDINYRQLLNDDPSRYNLESINQYLLKNYPTVDKLEELLNNGTLPSNVISTFLLPQYVALENTD